jgi:hypothetical protein
MAFIRITLRAATNFGKDTLLEKGQLVPVGNPL